MPREKQMVLKRFTGWTNAEAALALAQNQPLVPFSQNKVESQQNYIINKGAILRSPNWYLSTLWVHLEIEWVPHCHPEQHDHKSTCEYKGNISITLPGKFNSGQLWKRRIRPGIWFFWCCGWGELNLRKGLSIPRPSALPYILQFTLEGSSRPTESWPHFPSSAGAGSGPLGTGLDTRPHTKYK